MSTALSEPFNFDCEDNEHGSPKRYLESVVQETLSIHDVPRAAINHAYRVAHREQMLADPADEYAPQRMSNNSAGQSNIVYLAPRREHAVEYRRYLEQREAIKHMTQTIGAAFVEAELGLRSFMQLSSWMELELFQKLRARVERTAKGNHLAKRCNAPGDTKVPAVTPIGVRATVRDSGEWETSMTIRVGQRARAIAMRLQLHRERWKVVAFEIG